MSYWIRIRKSNTMNNLTKLIACSLIIVSCNNSKKVELSADTLVNGPTEKPAIALDTVTKIFDCYMGVQKKDTISLKLVITDNVVSGDLEYNFFEKDGNIGKVKGYIAGDTLFAKYTFQSEGVASVREVVFLTSNNMLKEGYGEQIEKSGQSVFLNKVKLDFSKGISLKSVDCQ